MKAIFTQFRSPTKTHLGRITASEPGGKKITVAYPNWPLYPESAIGVYAKHLIRMGKTNDEAVHLIKRKFWYAATTPANISWYRNVMKKEDAAAHREAADALVAKLGWNNNCQYMLVGGEINNGYAFVFVDKEES